jgi:hypothetical protein
MAISLFRVPPAVLPFAAFTISIILPAHRRGLSEWPNKTESPTEIIKHAIDQVVSHSRSTYADIEAIRISTKRWPN